jgi:hypothetical protein
MADTEASAWMPIRKVVSRISRIVGGDLQAKQMIATRLRDLEFTACADLIADGIDMGAVRLAPPTVSETKFGSGYATEIYGTVGQINILGPAFWRFSHDLESDLKRWDWGFGLVVLSRPPLIKSEPPSDRFPPKVRFGTRSVAYNVRVRRAEIDAILGVETSSQSLTAEQQKVPAQVAPLRKFDWEPVLIDLMMVADLEGLAETFQSPFVKGNQVALETWLKQRMAARFGSEPSESEVRKRASAVFAALRARLEKEQAKKP